jgi:peptidoglycan/xylan/chitin deacetylase (PgdA/CDA1 family)
MAQKKRTGTRRSNRAAKKRSRRNDLAVLALGIVTIFAGSWLLYSYAGGQSATTRAAEGASTSSSQASATPSAPVVSAYRGSLPIVMYHYIRDYATTTDTVGMNLSVKPETFGKQLDALKADGWTSITFADVANGRVPEKSVILTFDDGYDDAFTNAFPELQKRGMKGVFYIVSGFVGQPGYANWEQLRAMQAAGMELGAHTTDHRDLATMPADQQRMEIDESITAIRDNTGTSVVTFAYPSGKYNDETLQAMRDSGVFFSVTTQLGVADFAGDTAQLRRVRAGEASVFPKDLDGLNGNPYVSGGVPVFAPQQYPAYTKRYYRSKYRRR